MKIIDWQILAIILALGAIATSYMFSPSSTPGVKKPAKIGLVLAILALIFALCMIGLRWAVGGR